MEIIEIELKHSDLFIRHNLANEEVVIQEKDGTILFDGSISDLNRVSEISKLLEEGNYAEIG